MFKTKTGDYLEFLTSETIKLLGITKRKVTKNEIGENVSNLEIIEVVLVSCKIVNNNYQQNWRVLCTFIPNKSFGQFSGISRKNFIILETFNSEFLYIEVWFTVQNSKPLEIKDKINMTLTIN